MTGRFSLLAVLVALLSGISWAQTATDLAALKGLAPLSILAKIPGGNQALASNYAVTGGLQNGTIRQATLLPFADQQQQALRDAFITDGNLAQLADGLGTTLGSLGVKDDRIDEMAAKCTDGDRRTVGNFVKLDKRAVKAILELAR